MPKNNEISVVSLWGNKKVKTKFDQIVSVCGSANGKVKGLTDPL